MIGEDIFLRTVYWLVHNSEKGCDWLQRPYKHVDVKFNFLNRLKPSKRVDVDCLQSAGDWLQRPYKHVDVKL